MTTKKNLKPAPGAAIPSQPLLSRSSILILSGFLAGLGLCQGMSSAHQWTAVLTASCGLISFFVLDGVSRRRAAHVNEKATQLALRRLECRIGRHVVRTAVQDEEELSEADRHKRDLMLYAIMSHGQ